MDVTGFIAWFSKNQNLLASEFSSTLFDLECSLQTIFSAAHEEPAIANFFRDPRFESEWQLIINEINLHRKEKGLYQIEIQSNILSFDLLFGLFIFNKATSASDNDRKIELLLKADEHHSYHAATVLLFLILENLNSKDDGYDNALTNLYARMEKMNALGDSAGFLINAFAYLQLAVFFKDENPITAIQCSDAARECFGLADKAKDHSQAAINNYFFGKPISAMNNLGIEKAQQAQEYCEDFAQYIQESMIKPNYPMMV
ncbi:MAG: DUF5630 domain-containing protein [Proteobacteria bacterium]|nr:DUF5630 domain-containing protein [Pseudomonadota bacterium]